MRRAILTGVTCIAVTVSLTSCSPGIPVAYHVTEDAIDIAFCDEFSATSMEIDFGRYGESLNSIALQSATGPEVQFGDGVPISRSIDGWTFTSDSDAIPKNWERIDFTFYDAYGEYAGGEYLFRSDVKTSDWAWTEGFNIIDPQCQADLG